MPRKTTSTPDPNLRPKPSPGVIKEIRKMLGSNTNVEPIKFGINYGYRVILDEYGCYECPSYGGLKGFIRLAELLNCTDGQPSVYKTGGGCETCDYGSWYHMTLYFWGKTNPDGP